MPPCTPWITGDDVADCCSVETTSAAIFDVVAGQASDLLFEISGRIYAGEYGPRTVRPACDSCACGYQVLSRGHVIGPWDYGYPLMLCDSCLVACDPSLVKLAGVPVRDIVEVLIDGVVLAASEYRLFQDRFLQRLNNGRWPTHSNYYDNPTGTGALESITVPVVVAGVVTITMQPRSVHLLEVIPSVPPGTPVDVAVPILAGAFVGQTLTASTGVWVGDVPIAYTYQWQTSQDGSSGWTSVAGATSSSYVVQSSDLSNYLRCSVIASNAVGTGDAAPSAPLGPIEPAHAEAGTEAALYAITVIAGRPVFIQVRPNA